MVARSSAIKHFRIEFHTIQNGIEYKYICSICGEQQETAVGSYTHIEKKHKKEIKEFQEINKYSGPKL